MNRFLFAIFSLTTALILTAEAKAFSVSPIGYRSIIEPGGRQTFAVEVNNNESGSRRFRVEVNAIRNTEEGRRYYESGVDPAEFWANASPGDFRLSPGETKTVNITISVPLGTPPGSHSLAIMVAAENQSRGEIGLSARSAIPLSLTVAGEVTERLVLRKFESTERTTGKKSWAFDLELYNEGTIEVRASGWLQIKDPFGTVVVSQPVVTGNAIIPQSLRRLHPEFFPTGILWPGKYIAKVAVQYGTAGAVLATESSFWYLPPYLALFAIGVLSILTIWLWRKTKKCP